MCNGAQSSYGSFACRALYLDSYFLQVTQKGTLNESVYFLAHVVSFLSDFFFVYYAIKWRVGNLTAPFFYEIK